MEVLEQAKPSSQRVVDSSEMEFKDVLTLLQQNLVVLFKEISEMLKLCD